jgi:hypothetical protein
MALDLVTRHDLHYIHRNTHRRETMTYRTYIVHTIVANRMEYFEVVACDREAAIADVQATYGEDVDVVSVGVV